MIKTKPRVRARWRAAVVALAGWCGWTGLLIAAPPPLEFSERPESGPVETTDGTATLSWIFPADNLTAELQQGDSAAFAAPVVRYAGPDAGSVRSGLSEGRHFFRVRAVDETGEPGPWSEPLEVSVEFMARGQLLLLLSLGGIVVLMTAGGILVGHFRHQPERRIEAVES